MNTYKKRRLILGGVQYLLVCIGLVALLYSYTLYHAIDEQVSYNSMLYEDTGYFQLHSDYDGLDGRKSISEFLSSDERGLFKLKSMYEELINSDIVDFYEVTSQSLEYIGDYTGEFAFVDGEDESVINQDIGKETITPLYSVQIGNQTSKKLMLANKVAEGNYFTDKDYTYRFEQSECIPVILGDNYKNRYRIGDTFKGYFTGDVVLNCKVIGFLQMDVTVPSMGEPLDLSNYIVLPSFSCDNQPKSEAEKEFQQFLYLIKTEGDVKYSGTKQYDNQIAEVGRLCETIGIEYRHESELESPYTEYTISTSLGTARIILALSILFIAIIAIVVVLFAIRKINYSMRIYAIELLNGKSYFRLKLSIGFWYCVQIALAYIFAFLVCRCLFTQSVLRHMFLYYQSTIVLYIILYAGLTIVLLYAFMRNKNIYVAIRRED